jgi:hypothetical protein
MDPTTVYETMMDSSADALERVDAATDLLAWLVDMDGFAPSGIARGDAIARAERVIRTVCTVNEADGISLWECECNACLRIQRDAADELEGGAGWSW